MKRVTLSGGTLTRNVQRKGKGNKKKKDSMAFKVLFLFNTEIFRRRLTLFEIFSKISKRSEVDHAP